MTLNFLLKTFSEEDERPLQKKKPTGIDLAGLMQREKTRLKKKKGKFRHAGGHFNPSMITYSYCNRIKVAQLAGLIQPMVERPAPKQQLRFDAGHAYHDIIQGYFWDFGLLEGWFECFKCDHYWYDRSPQECKSCGAKRKYLHFKEVPLVNEDYNISARSDGYVWLVRDKSWQMDIFDIKTIQNKSQNPHEKQVCFEDLEELGAKPDHIIQLRFYLWLADVKWGHLLYVATNSHQTKSFCIERDDTSIWPYLRQIEDTIVWSEMIKQGQKDELPAPCAREKCKCQEVTLKSENQTVEVASY